ncbi:MAG: ferrous iron transport protein A [Proteobacteria bacterium]|nr:ferrous iron transport protein A [Pseudomonadota bacterium]MCK4867036.1 ferrous iron transport protein A [Alphaproteobacteria bacterium]
MYQSEFTEIASRGEAAVSIRLGRGAKGLRGTVLRVGGTGGDTYSETAMELERQLLEIGFVEGASVEIIHEGFIRGDPIAVKLDDMRVALRRRDAEAILIRVAT